MDSCFDLVISYFRHVRSFLRKYSEFCSDCGTLLSMSPLHTASSRTNFYLSHYLLISHLIALSFVPLSPSLSPLFPSLCFPCLPVSLCFSLVCSDSNLLLVWHVVYSFSVCWLSISLMSTTRFYPKFDSEVHSGVVRCRLQYFDLISVHHSCAYRIGWGFVVGATWIILFHWLHRTCSCWFFFCLFYSDHFCHYSGAPSLISSI